MYVVHRVKSALPKPGMYIVGMTMPLLGSETKSCFHIFAVVRIIELNKIII